MKPTGDSREPKPGLMLGLMLLITLVWGSTWLAIKYGLRDVPPFTGASIRFWIAGSVMALLAFFYADREGGGRAPWHVVIAQGLFQFGLNYGLVYVAETVIPSGLVSVLWAVFPLFISLAGHFVLRSERLKGAQWLGMLVAFGGVAVLFMTDLARVDPRAVRMGLLVLLAPLSVSISTLLIKHRAHGASSLILNRDSMLIGAVVLSVCAAVEERGHAMVFTPLAIGAILYLALAGTVLTFGVYIWLLRYVPAYRMSLVSYATPVVALMFGAAFGGEPIGTHTLIGTGLVLGGVALVLPYRRRSAPA